MSTKLLSFYWLSFSICLVASVINIMEIVSVLPNIERFGLGLAIFLFCILGHILYLGTSLILGFKFNLKRWPMWFMLIHPLIAMIIFSWINRVGLRPPRKAMP